MPRALVGLGCGDPGRRESSLKVVRAHGLGSRSLVGGRWGGQKRLPGLTITPKRAAGRGGKGVALPSSATRGGGAHRARAAVGGGGSREQELGGQ